MEGNDNEKTELTDGDNDHDLEHFIKVLMTTS